MSNGGCSIRIVENNRWVCQGVDSVCSELFLAGKVNFTVVGVEVGGRDGFGRVPFGDVDLVPRIPGLSPAEEFQDSVNDHRSKPPHKCAADGEGWSTEALVSGSVGGYCRDAEFWITRSPTGTRKTRVASSVVTISLGCCHHPITG